MICVLADMCPRCLAKIAGYVEENPQQPKVPGFDNEPADQSDVETVAESDSIIQ